MTYYTYPVSIEKEEDGQYYGQYYAYSEDLPGAYGLGHSIDEAKASILEGIRLYIEECKKDGKPIPVARTIYSETVSVAVE